mmetsp:Transcript_148/g.296  ORF Transcript_148/g.296 Transcript_148/m.296 type:complete len:86 (+) Transcript_148:1222-1479(+)
MSGIQTTALPCAIAWPKEISCGSWLLSSQCTSWNEESKSSEDLDVSFELLHVTVEGANVNAWPEAIKMKARVKEIIFKAIIYTSI